MKIFNKKRLIISILIIAISISASSTANISFSTYSRWNIGNKAQIKLMGNELSFSNSPYVLHNEIMVPAVEFLELIGANVTWNPNNNELISYKDNIFLKINQNNFIAYTNGKSKNMGVPAVKYKNQLYAPLVFLIKTYELSYKTTALNSIDIDYKQARNDLMTIGYTSYKKFSVLDKGISLFVPDYYVYNGNLFTNEHDQSKIEILKPTYNSTEERIQELKTQNIHATKDQAIKLGNYTFDSIKYKTFIENQPHTTLEYLIFEHNNPLIIKFIDCPTMIAQSVASTVYAEDIILNTNLEHYYEMPGFIDNKITIESKIHSNMSVKNNFKLKGRFQDNTVHGTLKIKVYRNQNAVFFEIPVEKGVFEGYIYVPFGLGKHNIEISFVDAVKEGETLSAIPSYKEMDLLKFSVLNESKTNTSDLLETKYIDYNKNEIYNLINAMGYYATNQYENAKGIYAWIIDHYSFTDIKNTTNQINKYRKMSELALMEEKNINEIEACILYAGFLRACKIPSKIAYAPSVSKYWVECFINGKWIYMGINEDMQNKTYNHFYKAIPKINKFYFMP